MPEKNAALRRRIAPFTPLTLELDEPGGKIKIELKLAFNMNSAAAVQEETGYLLTDVKIWNHIGEPKLLRAMLWAAAIAHQPEYESRDGLPTIGSYIQEENSEQIVDALWKAYLSYLPPAKRELLLKAKAEAEQRAERGEPNRPLETSPAMPLSNQSIGGNSGPSPEPMASALTNSAS